MANVAINPNTDPYNPLNNVYPATKPATQTYGPVNVQKQPAPATNTSGPVTDPTQPLQPQPAPARGPVTRTGPGLTVAPQSWQTELANFQTMADKTATELAKGGYDPTQQARYYEEAKAPIESDFYKAADQTSAYLARQGMGSSQGINIAATSNLNQQRSSLESQANLKATDLAQELRRRSLLDSFSTEAMKTNTDLQSHGIDVSSTIAQMQIQTQLEALQKQLDAQSSSGIGSLIGTGISAAAAIAILSDREAKKDVTPAVDGVFFTYKHDGSRHFGVIAQDIEEEFPDAVVTKDGKKYVNYGRYYIQKAMR